ncbi:hypothetical protein [Sphingobium sp. CECT 9361]|uniref:hypothetical protein n=1 Tax=Sphingobium sp. CECT 9361 TaxID=2845384 RepID=UPI001E2FA0DE|nr:hypothetical protein [Sphingobium sp. CECT 9361]CAH0355350.1 hypothetical protein SPH9361_03427 [Sphingobium sp. CECT 9361]
MDHSRTLPSQAAMDRTAMAFGAPSLGAMLAVMSPASKAMFRRCCNQDDEIVRLKGLLAEAFADPEKLYKSESFKNIIADAISCPLEEAA